MKQIPRRKVLQWGLGAGAMGALAACAPPAPKPAPTTTTRPPAPSTPQTTTTSTTTTSTTTTTTTLPPPPPVGTRSLVVIDMAGGHDGNSLGIPFADGAYYSRRPTVSIPANQVRQLNNQFGLHPNLARVHRRPLALVEGLGHPNPDFSHSEMLRRWWFGDTDGKQFPRYGFLGRLCDVHRDVERRGHRRLARLGTVGVVGGAERGHPVDGPVRRRELSRLRRPRHEARRGSPAHRAMSQEDRAEATMLFAGRTRHPHRAALQRPPHRAPRLDDRVPRHDPRCAARCRGPPHPRRRRHPHRARAVRR